MAKRAMTPEMAALKKIGGHLHEFDFADLIGGEVNRGSQQDKKDVIDKSHRMHSVKGGTWWQIFLYRRSRLETNTIFQGNGDVANIMIACLDIFPENREDYENNKHDIKIRLQDPMRRLREELQKPKLLPTFLSKGLFNGGEVNYLSIRRGAGDFHIFAQEDVVRVLSQLNIENSKSRRRGQYDCQKVLFKTNVNVGEIEVRTDSDVHYREMKCRFNGDKIFALLDKKIPHREIKKNNVIAYGEAVKSFKL